MTNQQGISMTIDLTELENGMNVIHSMAHAILDSKLHSASLRVLSEKGHVLFGKYADAAGPSIAHMYEWNQAGNPKSRLFRMDWRGHRNERQGSIVWMPSKSIVPASQSHEATALEAGVVLSKFIWEDKAYKLETRTTFLIRPMGERNKRAGWKRIPGSHAPAKRLMVQMKSPSVDGRGPNKDIIWVKKYTETYEYEGRFKEVFNAFWRENNFRSVVFVGFRRIFYKNVYQTFQTALRNVQVAKPVPIMRPGIHVVSNGKKSMSDVGGKPIGTLVRRYSRQISKGISRERF